MHRLFLVACTLIVLSVAAPWASAQDFGKFPEYPGVAGGKVTQYPNGPGFYLSWIKILVCWLIFFVWVRSVDWISQDADALKLNYRRWNMVAFFTFSATVLLLWTTPWFWLSMPLMFLAWLVPLVVYVKYRNTKVTDDESVFTAPHLRFWLSEKLRYVGIKLAAEKHGKNEAPPVELQPRGRDDRTNAANLLLARQSSGFALVQHLIADATKRRAESVLLDFTQEAVAVRFQIDSVWHDIDSRERDSGDAMLAVMKTISGLDANQRVARQAGEFGAVYEKLKYTGRLVSQGTKTGERVLLQIVKGTSKLRRLEDIDMRPKLLEDLKAVLAQPNGIIVVSTPPAGGLTTLFDATIGSMDRFTRSFVAVESAAKKELDVENVQVVYFNPAASENPASVLPKLIREHPDVFVVPDMVDVESAEILCGQAIDEGRMVVTSVRAKEAAESLLRILMLKVPAARFAPAVVVAINQRLIRKLCNKCKEAYAPAPQVFEQLGIPAGRVESFYRPPQPPEDDAEICKRCLGVGYFGRTAMYEVLIVDEGVRTALTNTPQLAAVRQAARKAGMRTLQEEGIVLVAKGVTSLPELMRVLKE